MSYTRLSIEPCLLFCRILTSVGYTSGLLDFVHPCYNGCYATGQNTGLKCRRKPSSIPTDP